MATYAEKDFDSNNYQEKRPGYPDTLYKALFEYHQGPTKKAVDIGCGPGTASFPMLDYVDQILATDPSEVMILPGIQAVGSLKDRIEFKVAPAEDLSKVCEDGSADVMISAEALHWVKHDDFFKEAARVLRSGGTLAYWGYIEPRFVDFPKANEIYEKYVFEDERFMGPAWVQPGKNFLRYFFDDVIVPDSFTDVEKHDYYPGQTKEHTAYFLGDEKYTMKKFAAYLSSWSAVHTWRKSNVGEKDLIEQFIDELKETCGWSDETELRVEWGTTYIFARRR